MIFTISVHFLFLFFFDFLCFLFSLASFPSFSLLPLFLLLSLSLPPFLSQLLAANTSDENRAACAATTKPLIDAVEALTTFASSPQFASTPAKISAQARIAQEPIVMVLCFSRYVGVVYFWVF